jgi:hypothetical protein
MVGTFAALYVYVKLDIAELMVNAVIAGLLGFNMGMQELSEQADQDGEFEEVQAPLVLDTHSFSKRMRDLEAGEL